MPGPSTDRALHGVRAGDLVHEAMNRVEDVLGALRGAGGVRLSGSGSNRRAARCDRGWPTVEFHRPGEESCGCEHETDVLCGPEPAGGDLDVGRRSPARRPTRHRPMRRWTVLTRTSLFAPS